MAMSVTTSVLPVGEVGVPYTVTLAETGGVAPITWTKASGTIPTGLALAGSTGIVSGTPTITASAAAVEFEATDSTPVTPQTANSSGLTFTIYAALAISTISLPSATIGTPYSSTLATTGGHGAVTWAVTAGVLPTGLGLDGATGVISGTPTENAETATVTITATDALGGTSSQSLTITIPLAISTTSLPNAFPAQAYSSMLATTGGYGAVTWAITAGTLPAGLVLHTVTGVVFGTPTANAATATVTITATDALDDTSSQSLTITIPTEVVRNFNSSMAAFPGIPLVSVAGSSLPDVGTPANHAAQVQGGWENEGCV